MNPTYLLPLVLVLLLLGCTSAPSPKEVILSSIEKTENIDSVITDLRINMSTLNSDTATMISADIKQYKKGKKVRTDVTLTGLPSLQETVFRVYDTESGSYLCGNSGKWDCYRFNESVGLDSSVSGTEDWNEMGRKLVESDAIEFIGGVKELEINKRKCKYIEGNIDYTKAPGLGFSPDVKKVTFSQCLDDETGVVISGQVVMTLEDSPEVGGETINQIDLYVVNLNVNATIDDNVFELP